MIALQPCLAYPEHRPASLLTRSKDKPGQRGHVPKRCFTNLMNPPLPQPQGKSSILRPGLRAQANNIQRG